MVNTLGLKEWQEAGERTVEVLEVDRLDGEYRLLIHTAKGSATYSVKDNRDGTFRVKKVEGGEVTSRYTVRPGVAMCECRGRRLGKFRCRHVAMLQSLKAEGVLS